MRLDYDREDDNALAQRLGVRAHPAYAFVAPGKDAKVQHRAFGPLAEAALREQLDRLIAAKP